MFRRSPQRWTFWGWLGPAYGRYVVLTLRQPRRAALLLVAACLPALLLDVQFFGRVRAGLQDLLPADAPTVLSLEAIHQRLGGKSNLSLLAQSDDPQQNRELIRGLAERLSARRLPVVRLVQWNVSAEREWLLNRSALLMASEDFDALAKTFEVQIAAAKSAANPLAFDLGLPAAASSDNAARQRQLIAKAAGADRFPSGYLEDHDGHTVMMLIWLASSELELEPANVLVRAVEEELVALHRQFPKVRVIFSGEVQNMIEEHAAILADLSLSSLLVFVLVGGLIVFYFRSLRAVLAVVLALLPGLLLTFAIGRLTVGSLNSNTAFLGSIIAGNGINYPLLLLAYYRAVPAAIPRDSAFRLAAHRALPGTLGAAATASAAYAGLSAAHFRGFSEFGWIGGLGMLTTWAASFLALPIAVGLLNPPRLPQPTQVGPGGWHRFYDRPAGLRLAAAAFVVAGLSLSVSGVLAARRGGVFETSINALRNRESIAHGSASWDPKKNEILGVWLNPIVALTAGPPDRQPAAEVLRRALTAGQPPLAERVQTVTTFVPEPAEQQRRLAVLKRAARLRDGFWGQLPEAARPYVSRWLDPHNLEPITLAEVPDDLISPFREIDGRTDRVVLIYPSLAIDYDNANNILRFADQVNAADLPVGTYLGGSFLFMAELLRLVEREAPQVVLWVCLLVALALLPIFAKQPQRILVCVAVIAAVALSAQTIVLAFGVRLNMFNFAAVPITIGVGSDYVVNLYGAMDAFAVDARRAAARMGGAILLCSLTTVVGYLSLVFAQSGALRTFGWAAVLGEAMAVSTVLLVIPAAASIRAPPATPCSDELPQRSARPSA